MLILQRITGALDEIPAEWTFSETVGHYLKHHSQFSIAIAFTALSILLALLSVRKINHAASQPIRVTQINVFPLKSCAGISLKRAKYSTLGFEYDRQWTIIKASPEDIKTHSRPRSQFAKKQSNKQSSNQSPYQSLDERAVHEYLRSLEPKKLSQLIPRTMREHPHMATIGVRIIDNSTKKSVFQTVNQSTDKPINQPTDAANHELILSFPGRDDECHIPVLPDADAPVIPVRMWTGDHQLMLASVYTDQSINQWLTEVVGEPSVLVTFIDGNPEHHVRQIDSEYDVSDSRYQVQFSDNYGFLLGNQASVRDINRRVNQSREDKKHIEMSAFRPSIVVDGPSHLLRAWAEDTWRTVMIGTHKFTCTKPCDRCKMPTINQLTGIPDPDYEPIATMREFRCLTKVDGSPDGKVYFGEFLIQSEPSGIISVGDEVKILEKRKQFLQTVSA